MAGQDTTSALLVCRVHERICALPLAHVAEVMRPLPIDPMPGAPDFILGLSLIRGEPTPVMNMARLLNEPDAEVGRFVAIKVAGRPVALAVSTVEGARSVARASLSLMPSLLHDVGSDTVAFIGVRDAELLLVLDGIKLLPPTVVALMEAWTCPT